MRSATLFEKTYYPLSTAREIALILSMSILLCLISPIAVRLPFSPVPMALQPHVVLLFAAIFKSRRATLIVLSFLAQGCLGLPVFAEGTFGIAHLLGPRGGYLIGYLAAAFITGKLCEKNAAKQTCLSTFFAMSIGNSIIYLLGCMHLSLFIPFKQAVLVGILPFIPGDLIKLTMGAKILHRFSK